MISNDYLNPSLTAPAGAGSVADTLFYPTLDPTPTSTPNPVFTFTFPNGDDRTGHGVRHPAAYARRTGAHQASDAARRQSYKGDMTIYRNPELWVDYFNGIYIKPAQENPSGEGNLFATNLAGVGSSDVHPQPEQNRPDADPGYDQASYLFYREDDPYGNVSINTIRHDYLAPRSIRRHRRAERTAALNPNVYVEGMDGVTELTLTDALF